MSILTLQVGQCGNQVGHALFSELAAAATEGKGWERQRVREAFFRESDGNDGHDDDNGGGGAAAAAAATTTPLTARSILVDMEPKVIGRCVASARAGGLFRYGAAQVTKQEGSANNWAYGYHVQGLCALEDVLEHCARECERMDSLNGVSLLHSTAGGTGSGVGSRLLEALRDLHPHTPLATASVLPLDSGEITTQHYNTLLTLNHLQRFADCSILVDNTAALRRLKKSDEAARSGGAAAARAGRARGVDFDRVNRAIAADVAGGVLLPAREEEDQGRGSGGGRRLNMLWDYVERVAPLCTQKFVTIYSSAATELERTGRWNVALNGVARELPGRPSSVARARASLLCVRGGVEMPEEGLARVSVASPAKLFGPANSVARGAWCPAGGGGGGGGGEGGGVFLSSNDGGVVRTTVARVAKRTREMLTSGAYLHHFTRYGVERDDCLSALATVEQAVKDYAAV